MAQAQTAAGKPTTTAWSRRLSYFQDAALICISALFFYAHASHAIDAKSFTNVFFAAEQALLIGMFLTRRRSSYTSIVPMDWVVATLGGWLPLLMRPHEVGGSAAVIGSGIQVVGLSLVILSSVSLGKSFGVVAANRGLKVGGLYRVVRHPIYFSHSVTLAGFVIANFWWFNVLNLAVLTCFQVLRICAEERVLRETADYAEYAQRVRWRLVPGLY
ncbi:MAG: isoprenylcysteine carboxylmethyltransferase family protein [Dehalococcoidia bacterium]